MGETTWWAFALAFATTLFTSAAQILYKFGSQKLSFSAAGIFTNLPFISGWILYGLGALVMIAALKGGEVTVLYPVVASSYIWVLLLSNHYFGEAINAWKIAGIFVIIAGIAFISWGSHQVTDKGGRGTPP